MSADPQAASWLVPAGARPHVARLSIEIAYRRAGLIALCALAGAAATLASAALPSLARPARVAAQVQRPRSTPVGDAFCLQLELDPARAAEPGRASWGERT
jgi:hypothetical protein